MAMEASPCQTSCASSRQDNGAFHSPCKHTSGEASTQAKDGEGAPPQPSPDSRHTCVAPTCIPLFSPAFRPTGKPCACGPRAAAPLSASPTPRETGVSAGREGDTGALLPERAVRRYLLRSSEDSSLHLSPTCCSMGIPSATSLAAERRLPRRPPPTEVSPLPARLLPRTERQTALAPKARASGAWLEHSAPEPDAEADGLRERSSKAPVGSLEPNRPEGGDAETHARPSGDVTAVASPNRPRPVSAPTPWAKSGSRSWDVSYSCLQARPRQSAGDRLPQRAQALLSSLNQREKRAEKNPPFRFEPIDRLPQRRASASGATRTGDRVLLEADQRALQAELRRQLAERALMDAEGPRHHERLRLLDEASRFHKAALSKLGPLKGLIKELDATFEMVTSRFQTNASFLIPSPSAPPFAPLHCADPRDASPPPASSARSHTSSQTPTPRPSAPPSSSPFSALLSSSSACVTPSAASAPLDSPPREEAQASTGSAGSPPVPFLSRLQPPPARESSPARLALSRGRRNPLAPACDSDLRREARRASEDARLVAVEREEDALGGEGHMHSPWVLAQLAELQEGEEAQRRRQGDNEADAREEAQRRKVKEGFEFFRQVREKLRQLARAPDASAGAFFASVRSLEEHVKARNLSSRARNSSSSALSALPASPRMSAPPLARCSGELGVTPPVLWLRQTLFREMVLPSESVRRKYLSLVHPRLCLPSKGPAARASLLAKERGNFCLKRASALARTMRNSLSCASLPSSCTAGAAAASRLRGRSSPCWSSLSGLLSPSFGPRDSLRPTAAAAADTRLPQALASPSSSPCFSPPHGVRTPHVAASQSAPPRGASVSKSFSSAPAGRGAGSEVCSLRKRTATSHDTTGDMETRLARARRQIAQTLEAHRQRDPDVDTVLLNLQELRPDATAEDFLRDIRFALRHLLAETGAGARWAVAAVELLVKSLIVTLDCELASHQTYMHQLEHLLLAHQSRDAELLALELRNRELCCLVDSTKRLKQEEVEKHEKAQAVFRSKIAKLVDEVARLTPNEEVVERTRDLMSDVAKALETQKSETLQQQELLEALRHTLCALAVGEERPMEALRDKAAGRLVELTNGELEIRSVDTKDAATLVVAEDLGDPDYCSPVKLRWLLLRQILLAHRGEDPVSLSMSDLVAHIERIYDFKTSVEFSAPPAPASAPSASEGPAVFGARLSLLEAWLEFEVEEFGFVSQGEKKVAHILATLLGLLRAAGGRTEGLPTEVKLFARFLGLCELTVFYPPPLLSVFLGVRQQCMRWRRERLASLASQLRLRQASRERRRELERQQRKVLEEVMKETRLEILSKTQRPAERASGLSRPPSSTASEARDPRSPPIPRPLESAALRQRLAQASAGSPLGAQKARPRSALSAASSSSASAVPSAASSSSAPRSLAETPSAAVTAPVEQPERRAEAEEADDGGEDDRDLAAPPPHLVAASAGFAAAVEGLRGLPPSHWPSLLNTLAMQVVRWSPSAPSVSPSAAESAAETAGRRRADEAVERSWSLEASEGAASRDMKEKLMRAFLREAFCKEFAAVLEQKVKEAKLRRRKQNLQSVNICLELSHAQVEAVLDRTGLRLPGDVWKPLLDPLSTGQVELTECILCEADSPPERRQGLLEDAYLPLTDLLEAVVEAYTAAFKESMETPLSRFRSAVEAKGSSRFSRAEFRRILKTIDAGATVAASNALFAECRRLRAACTVDSEVTSLRSREFLDFVEDAIPEDVFYVASLSQGHFFAPTLALRGLAEKNFMTVREVRKAPGVYRRRPLRVTIRPSP
ncbi:hypothetical protein BESB_063280 [Besnoitia besnoiti]|uniref:Uncharacterized protein n=1 Tax=Besnoitia besnoiti TaxID=94643 RepID=A0A2A9MGQ5_BESBE|nr:hypothetical protein BESB_063280 [Besnoitia besnoiti]PFH35441.1 hypothetical protein BESB_063280 [Besnoitia besnoiti]